MSAPKLTRTPVAVSLLLLAVAIGVDGCKQRDPEKPQPQVAASASAATSAAEPASTASSDAQARASAPVNALADAPSGVDWLPGDKVEEALAQAAKVHKPVFLFWGAVWCPYCKDLKANVFSRADFREKLRLFVPVYLDGDTEGAQKWGDRFRIAGYPTVLVLRPDQSELARIAGGMDLNQYASVLDLVLGDVEPVDQLLARAAKSKAALSADDCRRLAYNAWGLDATLDEDSSRLGKSLDAAAQRCPGTSANERARLTVIAAGLSASGESKQLESGRAPSAGLKQLIARVDETLNNRAFPVANADVLQYLDEAFFKAIAMIDPGKTADWLARWSATMDAAADDTHYTPGDRLAAVNSKLVAAKALSPGDKIPAQLIADANHRIDAALESTRDPMPRAGVVNASINILDTVGDPQRAYDIAAAEVPGSKTPYYYLADMADLADELGHREDAVSLRERAYHESSGAATRFQWGSGYLLELIRVHPSDDSAIRSAALDVLGELDGPNRLYSRSRTRLARISASLKQWSEGGKHGEAMGAIRARMGEICGKIPDTDAAKQSCKGFLA